MKKLLMVAFFVLSLGCITNINASVKEDVSSETIDFVSAKVNQEASKHRVTVTIILEDGTTYTYVYYYWD